MLIVAILIVVCFRLRSKSLQEEAELWENQAYGAAISTGPALEENPAYGAAISTGPALEKNPAYGAFGTVLLLSKHVHSIMLIPLTSLT